MRRSRRFKRRCNIEKNESRNECENPSKKTEVFIVENEENKSKESEEDTVKECDFEENVLEDKDILKEEIKEEINDECEVVIKTKTIPIYPNDIVPLKSVRGKIVVKIPVIISQFSLKVSCEADIDFNDIVTELKDIQENVYLTDCYLLPKADKLFFSGYIRKSIEYASISYRKGKFKKRPIKNIIINIPFQGVTEVEYISPPIINTLKKNNEKFAYIKDDKTGNDLDEFSFKHSQKLNEKIFCEMIRADVFETNIISEKIDENNCEENAFRKLQQKFVIDITLRLIQNQDILIQ